MSKRTNSTRPVIQSQNQVVSGIDPLCHLGPARLCFLIKNKFCAAEERAAHLLFLAISSNHVDESRKILVYILELTLCILELTPKSVNAHIPPPPHTHTHSPDIQGGR
jgi:hypothetical protein